MKIIAQVTTRPVYAFRPRIREPVGEMSETILTCSSQPVGSLAQAPTPRRTLPVKHLARLLVVFVLAAIAATSTATAANRMWMGFHDDPVFRWNDGRMDELDKAVFEHATIIRTLVTWANVAPTTPTNATDPFDPAYKLDDVD